MRQAHIPLLLGGGHDVYLHAMRKIVVPLLKRYKPDVIVVASGYDAAFIDPMSRMCAVSNTYYQMTRLVMEVANELCSGRLLCVHEGGYSEFYTPFCGHAVVSALSGAKYETLDPVEERFLDRQPSEQFNRFQRDLLDDYARQITL